MSLKIAKASTESCSLYEDYSLPELVEIDLVILEALAELNSQRPTSDRYTFNAVQAFHLTESDGIQYGSRESDLKSITQITKIANGIFRKECKEIKLSDSDVATRFRDLLSVCILDPSDSDVLLMKMQHRASILEYSNLKQKSVEIAREYSKNRLLLSIQKGKDPDFKFYSPLFIEDLLKEVKAEVKNKSWSLNEKRKKEFMLFVRDPSKCVIRNCVLEQDKMAILNLYDKFRCRKNAFEIIAKEHLYSQVSQNRDSLTPPVVTYYLREALVSFIQEVNQGKLVLFEGVSPEECVSQEIESPKENSVAMQIEQENEYVKRLLPGGNSLNFPMSVWDEDPGWTNFQKKAANKKRKTGN